MFGCKGLFAYYHSSAVGKYGSSKLLNVGAPSVPGTFFGLWKTLQMRGVTLINSNTRIGGLGRINR
jgi:hypothetical protein